MTILLRRIHSTKDWVKRSKGNSGELFPAGDLPTWSIRDFVPSERDGTELSVFEVEDESGAETVAGAFAFQEKNLEGGSIFFLAVEKQKLISAGCTISETGGGLAHSVVDRWHRLIRIENLTALTLVVRLFAGGSPISVEGKVAGAAARNAARADHISFLGLSSLKFETNWRAKNLARFLDDKVVSVHGIRESAT